MLIKLAVFGPLAVAAVASAHDPLEARQAAGSSSRAASVGSVPPASGSAAPTQSFSFTLAATNPTAIPLASIVSGTMSQATTPLPTTFTAGATPTAPSGAPPLPNAAALIPSNYPALDKVVPTDTPEVQQWIAEVNNSGIVIPDIAPTVAGGCPANLDAVADTSRCWWTCGGCVRDTDITTCPQPLTWGLTYDDGPSPYTENLLQFLGANNLHTTFFEVGSRVISWPQTTQFQYMMGHQIAVHTWSHPSLTTLTTAQIIGELGWSKKIIKDTIGVTPTHFRPPFGDIDDRVRAIAAAMDLIPVIWTRISPEATFDTNDFNLASGLATPSEVLQNWDFIKGNTTIIKTGFILLEHDLFPQSVDIATGYILPDALVNNPKFNIVPVITCLNKPMEDAYIETNNNASNPIQSGFSSTATGSSGIAQTTGSGKSSGAMSTAPGRVVPVVALIFAVYLLV